MSTSDDRPPDLLNKGALLLAVFLVFSLLALTMLAADWVLS